ncbi:MAG: hypothetical protein U0167_16840 [bacterium]
MSASGRAREIAAPLFATLAVAAVIRLLYWRALDLHRELIAPVLDGAANLEWARGLLDGTWPGAVPFFRAPGYVAALGALVGAVGPDPAKLVMAQLAFGLLTPLLTALLAARLFGARAAWIAGLGAAAYPTFLFFDGQFLSPCFAVPAFLAGLWLGLDASERGGWLRAASAGLLLGFAGVTWPPLLVAALAPLAPLVRKARRDALVAAVALLLAPLLATAHNAACGDPAFIATQGGLNLYLGNARSADGMSATFAPAPTALGYRMVEAAAKIAERAEGRALRPSEVSAYWTGRTLAEIRADPARWGRLVLKKAGLVFWAREIPNNHDFALFAEEIPLLRLPGWGWWLPLAVVGAWAARRRSDVVRTAGAGVVALLGCVAFFVNDRFRVPAAPLVVALGSGGVLAIVDAVRRGALRPAAALAGVAAVLAVAVRLNPYGVPERPWVMSYVLVAEAERDRGELVRSLRWIDRALAERPGLYSAVLARVELLRRTGRLGDARAEAEKALASLPEDPALLHERAVIRDLSGDTAGALGDVERAIARDPSFEPARVSRAAMLARLGRAGEATQALREFLASHPSVGEAARAREVLEEMQQGTLAPPGTVSSSPPAGHATNGPGQSPPPASAGN